MPAVYCSYTTLEPTASLIENPRNPNLHPEEQIIALAKIIRHQGWRNPIVVSKRSGFVIKGHGRLLAARMLGLEEVPVDMQDYENEAAEWADMIADNKNGNRTYAEQDKLFAQRPKVTNARGGQSWHNFGLAFDFGVFRGKGYLGDSPHYKTLGKLATAIPNTTWGGTWTKLVDEPHIQLNLFSSISAARVAFEK